MRKKATKVKSVKKQFELSDKFKDLINNFREILRKMEDNLVKEVIKMDKNFQKGKV